jgi:quinol monooxygenase YgiN
MTILVMGHVKLAKGEGERARPILTEHMAAVAQEEGCEEYTFSFDATDPDLVRVAERWASAEALAAHGQAEHQKAFGRRLREFTVESSRVDAWDGQFWRNLLGG